MHSRSPKRCPSLSGTDLEALVQAGPEAHAAAGAVVVAVTAKHIETERVSLTARRTGRRREEKSCSRTPGGVKRPQA